MQATSQSGTVIARMDPKLVYVVTQTNSVGIVLPSWTHVVVLCVQTCVYGKATIPVYVCVFPGERSIKLPMFTSQSRSGIKTSHVPQCASISIVDARPVETYGKIPTVKDGDGQFGGVPIGVYNAMSKSACGSRRWWYPETIDEDIYSHHCGKHSRVVPIWGTVPPVYYEYEDGEDFTGLSLNTCGYIICALCNEQYISFEDYTKECAPDIVVSSSN